MKFLFRNLPPPMDQAFAKCRPFFISAAVFSALINILYLAPTLYMMQVYDRVVPTGGVLTLFWLTVIIALAIGTLTALDNIRSRVMMRAALRLDIELSGSILDRLVARAKHSNDPAAANAAMREFDNLRQAMTGPATMAAFDVPWTPIYIFAAFAIHPVLGLLICFGGAVLITIAVINERVVRKRSKQGHQANAAAYAAQEMLTSKAEIIRVMGMRRAIVARQKSARGEGLFSVTATQLSTTRYSALVKFVRMFLQSLSLGVGAWLAINGQISIGTIIAASVLLSRALQPIEQLVGSWPVINQSRNSMASLKALFEKTEADDKKPLLLPEPKGHVDVNSITLRNPQGTAFIVHGVSFSMAPGEIVGLIGHSGAGKSTVAQLMAGAIRPDAGEVRIDGATFDDWDQENLAQHIGYLPQDCALLPGTIVDNISRFSPELSDSPDAVAARVVHAAQMVGIHDLILRMPDGYGTQIEDSSFRLSGGQAQRIALARAIYGSPKILILDEPSSALDAEGEQALLRVIEAAKLAGSAILMVAHRSFILSNADKLVVMSNGTLEHQGPRLEVIEKLRGAAQNQNVVNLKRG
jgi:PrtD family type I secretion system ABC transporter